MAKLSLEDFTQKKDWLLKYLSLTFGAYYKHEPFFRKFPEGVPKDTEKLWWKRVLCHFMQGEEQACIFCGTIGTTHVLDPCLHVVCDKCFDGANYSACPICNYKVDRNSPFFKPSVERPLPKGHVTFKLLRLGHDLDERAKELFTSFCLRQQAMAENDKTDLLSIVKDYGTRVFNWLPKVIPLKENMALLFGTLFQYCPPSEVLPTARLHLKTATDILRFIIAASGGDPSLQPQVTTTAVSVTIHPERWWGEVAKLLKVRTPGPRNQNIFVPIKKRRTRIFPMSRSLRRALLQLLDEMPWENLMDDMLRHQSWWVWVGEFLHPYEYRKRFPRVTKAFEVIRKKSPEGQKAKPHRTFYGKVEKAAKDKDIDTLLNLLGSRPGEFARRLDHLLRLASDDSGAIDNIIKLFQAGIEKYSTPVLATLHNHLPLRKEKSPFRIYWPKGAVSRGISDKDNREPLPEKAINQCMQSLEEELLHRFSKKKKIPNCLIDRALKQVIVPFNERTASPGAIDLPRGSSMKIDDSKTLRLFLHWCEPKEDSTSTDLDLSVGFYDDKWQYQGVCSYYQLEFTSADGTPEECLVFDEEEKWIARSAGDLVEAPYPDGASEFIDLHCKNAQKLGIRYAVMVINSYAGMPFSALERAFAGVMLRDDPMGKHFDPRSVELKFALRGESGIFMPLVLDIEEMSLHWLDVFSKGQLIMNNVETSNKAIQIICPQQIEYFQRGTRMNMFELLSLHAASRSRRVYLRDGDTITVLDKKSGETNLSFLERLYQGEGPTLAMKELPIGDLDLAALFRGDLELSEETLRYILFPEKTSANFSASDLLSTDDA